MSSWKDVNEELPGRGQVLVRCVDTDGNVSHHVVDFDPDGAYDPQLYDCRFGLNYDYFEATDITHWIELPEFKD